MTNFTLKIRDSYHSSPLPINEMIEYGLWLDNAEKDKNLGLTKNQTGIVIAIRQKDGGWSLWGKSQKNKKGEIYTDITFENMLSYMFKIENQRFKHLGINNMNFKPNNNTWIPTDYEIQAMEQHIEKNELPQDHVCRLFLAIGLNKKIVSEVFNNAMDQKKHIYRLPTSEKGSMGTKLNLN